MKIIITERQFNLIEQAGLGIYGAPGSKSMEQGNKGIQQLDTHTIMTVLAIGAAFIPVAGPFISAGIGLADASLYYKEGDTKTAGITAVLSILPFVGSVAPKIPGVKQLGVKGMALLASKIGYGKALTNAEIEIANSIKDFQPQIQKELSKMAPKLKSVMKELELYKSNFVQKYGESEYNRELTRFLYNDTKTAKVDFVNKLKNVKTPTIKIKPILGGGADHRVYASVVNPNVVFKAEIRPGEVDKWYDTFRKYPNIFAKTIKKTKVKDTTGKLLDAVVMEKLDIPKFTQLWDSLEKTLNSIPEEGGSTFEYLVKHVKEHPNYLKKYNQVLELAKQKLPSLKNSIDEFKTIVDQLYKITPNPDIRKFNFGYDLSGALKALDI
jgi:hypothetical protein